MLMLDDQLYSVYIIYTRGTILVSTVLDVLQSHAECAVSSLNWQNNYSCKRQLSISSVIPATLLCNPLLWDV